MAVRLIEIGPDGSPGDELALSAFIRSVCAQTAALYQRSGFQRPWNAYLAEQSGQLVGTCAFKSPPRQGRVEIAYYTFPEHAGQGIATDMARQLTEIAAATDPTLQIIAQTLPDESASTAVLRKLGFDLLGTVQHPEDGEVWEWRMRQP